MLNFNREIEKMRSNSTGLSLILYIIMYGDRIFRK